MKTFLITFTLLATMALLCEGKPVKAAGKCTKKNSKKMNENFSELIGEECEDVCPPIPGNNTAALECASCIVNETGSSNLSDFLSAIASARSEKNCPGRDELESMDEISENGSGETSRSLKSGKSSKSRKSGKSDDGSGEMDENSGKSNKKCKKQGKGKGKGKGKGNKGRCEEEDDLADIFAGLIGCCHSNCAKVSQCGKPILPCLNCLIEALTDSEDIEVTEEVIETTEIPA